MSEHKKKSLKIDKQFMKSFVRPSASIFKSFSRSLEQFLLKVGQNNFGNKIPNFLTTYPPLLVNLVFERPLKKKNLKNFVNSWTKSSFNIQSNVTMSNEVETWNKEIAVN